MLWKNILIICQAGETMGNTAGKIAELVNSLIETAIIFLYLNKTIKRRYERRLPYLFGFLISSLAIFAAEIFFPKPIFLISVTFVILILLSFLLYNTRPKISFFYIFIYLLIILIADPIMMGIMYILKLGSPNDLLKSGLERILGMVGTKMLYIWMVMIISRILMKKVSELPIKYWISIILMPIISIIVLYSIFISIAVADTKYSMVIYMISIAGMVYINVTMFNFFDSYSKQIKLKFMESVAEREAENYRALKISYQEIKKLKHDFQNELSVLDDMITEKRLDAAEKHINELSDVIEKSAAVCFTGNEAVDSLINLKIKEARQHNIDVISKVSSFVVFNVNSIELCRILGNAFDNAIEACCCIEENKERIIGVLIKEIDEKILIEIYNSSNFVDTDDFISSKSDKGLHGYGIQSIRSSAERIGATINFKYAEGVFTLRLLFKNT